MKYGKSFISDGCNRMLDVRRVLVGEKLLIGPMAVVHTVRVTGV